MTGTTATLAPQAPIQNCIETLCATSPFVSQVQLVEDVRKCKQQAEVLARSPDFYQALQFCLSTRHAWDAIHDVWLYEHGAEEKNIRSLTQTFIDATVLGERTLRSMLPKSEEKENRRIEHYANSVAMRNGFATKLLAEGIDSAYRLLLSVAKEEHSNMARDRVELPTIRTRFVQFGLHWLSHKLALLLAELRLEVGPYAVSTREHVYIARKAIHCVDGIRNCAAVLAETPASDDAEPFLSELELCLKRFSFDVINPLLTVLIHVSQRPGAWDSLDQIENLERDLGDQAERCITTIRGAISEIKKQADHALIQLEGRATKSDNLSVLVYAYKNSWVAHCLEYDLASSGPNLDASVQRLCDMLDAMFAEELSQKPRPAPPDLFDEFGHADPVSELRRSFSGRPFHLPIRRKSI